MPESVASLAARAKKTLIDQGFEVFRTRGDEIILAERPRENLIMDSGVRLRVGEWFEVRIVVRAQKADFPNEDEDHLFERARRLAGAAASAGFAEIGTTIAPVKDPSDDGRTLDTFYEVTYGKPAQTLEGAIAELRFALSLEKRA
jgi:hypothetical protein